MNPVIDDNMANGTMVEDRPENSAGSSVSNRHIEHERSKSSLMRRLMKTLMLVVVLIGGGVFGLYKTRVNIPGLNMPVFYAHLDSAGARAAQMKGYIGGKYEAFFGKHAVEEAHHEEHQILVTSPKAMEVTIDQDYVCQIHSQNHIDICALEDGYLEAIPVKEGQAVKTDDIMFQVRPVVYKAELAVKMAEKEFVELELKNTQTLFGKGGVSEKEVFLYKAKLAKAQAEVDMAQAKLNFASVRAPFDGIVDRLKVFHGSLVKEGDILTTLSDNRVMWVYFNVTEKRYLEYMAETDRNKLKLDVTLMLANHDKFRHIGKIDQAHNIGAIEAMFDNTNGNLAFRADFPNPEGLLRHGQTGTVRIERPLKDAIVIPQRATFENLAKRYVYVVGKDDKVVHQREIVIEHEKDDIFVVKSRAADEARGLDENDKIILEGIRQVHDGQKVESEFVAPEEALKNLKMHAE